MSARTWPDLICRWCRAEPGAPCIDANGKTAHRPHSDRVRDSRLRMLAGR